MRENTPLETWRTGGQTIGGWLSVGNAYTAEIMASMGFDWLCIDMQHGLLSYDDLRYMLPAMSNYPTIPFVRPEWNRPSEIMKALDAGAYGVIVPMVNNREEAEQAVSACRYPPEGGRSFGPIRAAMYAGPGYVQQANRSIACLAMVETEQALENLDEIASTPGLDGIYIGPSDLAYALGLPPRGDNDDPKHVATVAKILAVCQKHGIAAGMHTGSLAYTQRYLKQGFNLVMLGSDSAWMMQGARRELTEAKKTLNDSAD